MIPVEVHSLLFEIVSATPENQKFRFHFGFSTFTYLQHYNLLTQVPNSFTLFLIDSLLSMEIEGRGEQEMKREKKV
jgi:hypothetical protein